jgi:hypothetical protein
MILESWPWKQRLLKDADLIERWARKRPTQRRAFIIEQKVFLSAYAMRKLFESQKLSSSFTDRSVRCKVYPMRARRVTIANNHKIDKLYDWIHPSDRTIAAKSLLDLIVHSFIFAELVKDEDLTMEGFLVTSDRSRQTGLWHVDLHDFTNLMRVVGNDMPAHLIRIFDPKSGDWFTWQGNGEPPSHVSKKLEELTKRYRPTV